MAETTTEVITIVSVVDLLPGSPPALITVKRAVNLQGIARHITQKILVRDAGLAQRLFAEVRPGDEVTLTLTTIWTDTSYETDVTSFALPVKAENTPREVLAVR